MNTKMQQKLQLILSKEKYERITFNKENDEEYITIDLHYLSCRDAERLVRNVIAVSDESFELELIHGYIHGTALKQMLENYKISDRIIQRQGVAYNLGMTKMKVRAA